MVSGQYARNVQPLRLRTELVYPSFRGKISDFSLVHDQLTTPESPVWIETYHAYAPGTGVMAPSPLAPVVDGRPVEALKSVGQHAHNDFDEIYFFYGTDPTDNTRLGGQVEMWLGHGQDAEKFVMKDPTAVYVPKGLAHNPWIVTKVNDPKRPIMITTVALTSTYSLAPEAVTDYPCPPAFSPDLMGVAQPGKGRYAQYVNRLTLSRDIYISFLMGRVCVPSLMFDEKVCRAPLWAEFFLIYAGGTGIGVPTLADIARADSMSYWDFTKGMQHHQAYDEVFLYLPTDPHDTLALGGEAVEYLGDEGYSMTVPSAVYVPAGVRHNPSYFKRVDRPYYLIVLAMTDNARFHEGEFTPVPAPATFEF
jgi:mannose-6-phosphate isomerase-like protein (cupin superfamily)